MKKRMLSALLAFCLMLGLAPATGGETVSLDGLMEEIELVAEEETKALTVSPVTYEISPDGQSIFIDKPQVTGAADYTIAYNIYDSNSNPVNYFYSDEARVAATPGYGGLFNVFIVVTDRTTGETNTQDIGWHELRWPWPYAERLTVGQASYEISADGQSFFIDRPDIRCKSGTVTIAYNIYDSNANPVNYFYSNDLRVAATPGYAGRFNVFIVVTDVYTGECLSQNIGWHNLGGEAEPTAEPTATPTAEPTATPTAVPLVDETDPSLFTYAEHNNDATMIITGFVNQTGYPTEVTFPRYSPEGKLITEIHHTAFANKTELRSVTFQDNIRTIGDRAFAGCTLLREVNLAEGLTTIKGLGNYQHGAFNGCSKLTSIVIPSTVQTIGDNAFRACSQLSSLTILPSDDYQLDIGGSAFYGTALSGDLFIPAKVKNINGCAFYETPISSVTIEAGPLLVTLSNQVFKGCANLTSAVIPGNVATIGDEDFRDCTMLREVTLSEGLKTIAGSDGNTHGAFNGCSKLTEITIPSTVETIGPCAFFGCSQLASLTILPSEDYQVDIGARAFWATPLSGELVLPAKVKSIGSNAFQGTAISSLTIEPGSYLDSIKSQAFWKCENLTSVTIPGNVLTICDMAFKECILLHEVNLAEGLNKIEGNNTSGHGAFYGCGKLESVAIPSTVESIGDYAFYNCSQLASLTIAESEDHQLSIGKRAFENTALAGSLVLPARVKLIDNYAFYGTKIASLTIKPGAYLKAIGSYAFMKCESLKTAVIPGNVETINNQAFYGDCLLSSLTLNEGLKKIVGSSSKPGGAFAGCEALTGVVIPSTVTEIQGHAFCDCTSLATLTLLDSADYELEIGKSAFENTGLTSLAIPARVKTINSAAFYTTPMTSLTIAPGRYLTEIATDAFRDCANLVSAEIPGNVETIGDMAFKGCVSLTDLRLNEGLKTIGGSTYSGHGAFHGCSRLKSVRIPASVTEVKGYAFSSCTSLSSIVFLGSADSVTIGRYAFQNCPGTPTYMQ